MTQVTKAWKLYGSNGHKQEEILSSWDDVLDAEMEWLLEEFNRHRDTANI